MAAVSLAADLGMGQPLESGLANCVVAAALATRLGFEPDLVQRTYDLALLEHIGCTAVSAEIAHIMGDELVMRGHAATLDFADHKQMFRFMLGHVGRISPPLGRPVALARAMALGGRIVDGANEVCEAARMLAERCGYEPDFLADVECVYENWDGSGFPGVVAGEDISLPTRVVQVATLAASAHREGGIDHAVDIVGARSGHSLAPEIVAAFLADAQTLLRPLEQVASLWDEAIGSEPQAAETPTSDDIDRTLRAIADLVDLKSPWLRGHSSGVAALAASAATVWGLASDEVVTVRRAGWLHDVGRIGVSSAIWGRPGPLRPHEWEQVRLHSYYTDRVLDRTPFLRRLAAVAAAHHERLDGSGYFRGVHTAQLSRPARLLAAADAFHAMTEARPYREPLAAEVAAKELRADVSAGKLDGGAVDAVLAAAGQPVRRSRCEGAGGLTPRETETLCLVARGLSTKQIARQLTISPKTVDGHIQRIYAKIGVSTRAGATVFALQNDLLDASQNRENSP